MPLYFAYGSNMDVDAMRGRCPRSTSLGLGRLARHRVTIMREGYATVVRDPRRTVWGVLWDLALADMPALDRYEQVAGGLYAKISQSILTDTAPKRALVYVGVNHGPGTPQPGYLPLVVAAAEAAGCPAPYVAELQRLGVSPQAAPSGRTSASSERGREPGRGAWRWEP